VAFEPHAPIHLPPLEVGSDTFVIRSAQAAFGAPLSVSINSLVIGGSHPVLVDTGTAADRAAWLADMASLVDPAEVRWVFLSHDDDDHAGNLAEVLELCPGARLVTCWAAVERMGCTIRVPANRMCWVNDGDAFDTGDRTLHAVRPPVYDSPTTRGLFDPTTSVYWAADAFATPMPLHAVDHVDDLDPALWADGMALFAHHALSPWLSIVDAAGYRAQVRRLRALAPKAIAGAHTPVIADPSVGVALDLIEALPSVSPPAVPDPSVLAAAV
jgi:flavorubredoxin